MSDCRKCVNLDWCTEYEDCDLFRPKKMTNADRLRAMSDEELAEWFDINASVPLWCTPPNCPDHEECVKCILAWLKAPVEPGEVDE